MKCININMMNHQIYQKSQRAEEFYQWLFALENRTKQTRLTLAVAEIIAREDKKEAYRDQSWSSTSKYIKQGYTRFKSSHSIH